MVTYGMCHIMYSLKLCNLPTCCVHVFLIIIVSANISLYSVIRLIFVVKTGCVFYAEGIEYLNISVKTLRFRNGKDIKT